MKAKSFILSFINLGLISMKMNVGVEIKKRTSGEARLTQQAIQRTSIGVRPGPAERRFLLRVSFQY